MKRLHAYKLPMVIGTVNAPIPSQSGNRVKLYTHELMLHNANWFYMLPTFNRLNKSAVDVNRRAASATFQTLAVCAPAVLRTSNTERIIHCSHFETVR
jgi:hypothetical protein